MLPGAGGAHCSHQLTGVAPAAVARNAAATLGLQVDTAKDMVDNCAGMMLALISLATCSNSNSTGASSSSR